MELYLSTLGIPFPYITGTPVANQVTVFTSATQVQGSADFTFVSSAGLVVNESGGSTADVRFEGDTFPNLFLVDASADRIFITDAATGGTPPTAPTGGFTVGTLLAIVNNSLTNDNVVLTLIGGTAGNAMIDFGDADDANIGRINYDNINNRFIFVCNTATVAVMASNGYFGLKAAPNNPLSVASDWGAVNTLLLHNTHASDGRSTVEFAANRVSEHHWVLGMDPTGGSTKHFSLRDVTGANNSVIDVTPTTGKVGIGVGLITPSCQLEVNTATDIGVSAVAIQQDDDDEPFIDYAGTSAASSAKNISTWTAGNSIQGFVRVAINGSDYWMPYYNAPTS